MPLTEQFDDGLSGNPANKTELWLKSLPSIKYFLPETCPRCKSILQAKHVYVGVFPYIHTGVYLQCIANAEHVFTFCFPYNEAMPAGYTVFDTKEVKGYSTERVCPFHPEVRLEPVRFYGDLVFNDGTRKLQLRCRRCNFSERVTFKKS